MTALPAGMALFFVAASALAMLMWRPGTGRAFALAIAFGLAEYARGHVLTGLPMEPGRLRPARQRRDDAARLAVRRVRLSLLAVLLFASPAAIFTPSRIAGREVARHDLPRWRSAHRARRRRLVGRAEARRRREREHRHPGQDRAGRHRSGREVAPREQRRDLHRLSRSHQVGGVTGLTASRSWCGRRRRCRSFSPSSSRGARGDRRGAARKAPRCSWARRVSSRNATRKAVLTADAYL